MGRRRRKCVSSSKEAAENSIWNVQARLMKFAAALSLFTSFYALSSLPPENTYFEEGRSPVSTSVPNFALLTQREFSVERVYRSRSAKQGSQVERPTDAYWKVRDVH